MKFSALLHNKIFLAAVLSVAAAAVVTAAILMNKGTVQDNAYRLIRVFEIIGSANVKRTDTGDIAPYEGMNLQSGDTLFTYNDSNMRLNLDDTKMLLMEPDTEIELTAFGDASENITSITLRSGTVLNEIMKPLTQNSSYTVYTPKAVFTVRGTSFRVSVRKEADGSYITELHVYHGKVKVELLDENGDPSGKVIEVTEDQCILIKTDPNEVSGKDPAVDGHSYFINETKNGERVPITENDRIITDIDYFSVPYKTLLTLFNDDKGNELKLYSGVLDKVIEAMNRSSGETDVTEETEKTEEQTETQPLAENGTQPETQPLTENETQPVTGISSTENGSDGFLADENVIVIPGEQGIYPDNMQLSDNDLPLNDHAENGAGDPGTDDNAVNGTASDPEEQQSEQPAVTSAPAETSGETAESVTAVTSAPDGTTFSGSSVTSAPSGNVNGSVTSAPADISESSRTTKQTSSTSAPADTSVSRTTKQTSSTSAPSETSGSKTSSKHTAAETSGRPVSEQTSASSAPAVTAATTAPVYGGTYTVPTAPVWYTQPQVTYPYPYYNTGYPISTEIPITVTDTPQTTSETPSAAIYTVTFDSAGGTPVESQLVKGGETVDYPISPTREGYIFAGWRYMGLAYDFTTPVIKNITLKAEWAVDSSSFVVEFDSMGGSTVPSQFVAYGGKASVPDEPVKSGYTFGYWALSDGTKYDFSSPVTSDTKLIAIWNSGSSSFCIVEFDSKGGSSVPSQKVPYGDTASIPANPTKSGYTFGYWALSDGTTYDFASPVTSDTTLIAIWESGSSSFCTVTFTIDGSVYNKVKVSQGETVSPPTPSKEGYVLSDWMLSGSTFNFSTPINDDIVLTAIWIPNSSSAKHTLTFIGYKMVGGEYQWTVIDKVEVADGTPLGSDWEDNIPCPTPEEYVTITDSLGNTVSMKFICWNTPMESSVTSDMTIEGYYVTA